MKLSIQKSNALGEMVVIETENPEEFAEAFRITDARLLEMNNRILVSTGIQRRYGNDVWVAVREVMDTMFGNRPVTDADVQEALESQRRATEAAAAAAAAAESAQRRAAEIEAKLEKLSWSHDIPEVVGDGQSDC